MRQVVVAWRGSDDVPCESFTLHSRHVPASRTNRVGVHFPYVCAGLENGCAEIFDMRTGATPLCGSRLMLAGESLALMGDRSFTHGKISMVYWASSRLVCLLHMSPGEAETRSTASNSHDHHDCDRCGDGVALV